MSMRLHIRALIATSLISMLVCQASSASAQSVFGRWLTDDHAAIVTIDRCGNTLCGWIDRVLDPKAPENDINNPDKKFRSKPLVGTVVLRGFTRAGDKWADGRAYDPKTGNSYRSTLKIDDDGRLRVTGCILFLCRSRHWTVY